MSRKQLPLVVMLLAGGITAIVLRLMRYELESFLWILFLVLLIFYIAGSILKAVLDKFEAEEEEARKKAEEAALAGETVLAEDSEAQKDTDSFEPEG